MRLASWRVVLCSGFGLAVTALANPLPAKVNTLRPFEALTKDLKDIPLVASPAPATPVLNNFFKPSLPGKEQRASDLLTKP